MGSVAQADRDTIFVGGEWVAPSTNARIDVISPLTEQPIGAVPAGSAADIDRAVAAATRAFREGPWPAMTLEQRSAILQRWRDLIVEHAEELAQLITDEIGCPITQSRNVQVPNPILITDAYLHTAQQYPFRAVRRSVNGQAIVTREPVGVVAAVVPWNVPASLIAQKVVPALVTGCTVVLKPAPESPLNAYLLVQLLEEAGLPPGVVNLVVADREASQYLVSHPGVAKVTFTGSTVTGQRIAEICGHDFRKLTLELGGKSAAVVLEDADLDVVISSLRLGSFRNNGQVCSLKTRLVVPASRQTEFLDRLDAMVASMPVGDPHDEATEIGPLVSQRQRTRVEEYIRKGSEEGARLVRGGGRPAGIERGWFVEPTVFADVDPNATIAQEEIFGPVVAVIPYRDEDEAIAIANNSSYGLNGSVFTTDVEHGVQVAGRIHTGTVELNGNPSGFLAPMGGVKSSGMGREFGPEGLDPFIELKAIGISAELADQLSPQR